MRFPGCQREATCADHRANRGAGGAGKRLDGFSNLIAACGLCNGHKESQSVREHVVRLGLRVPAGRTHEHTAEKAREIPVTYPNKRKYMLCDVGHRHPELNGTFEPCNMQADER